MSFLKRMFGVKSFQEHRDEAERLMKAGEFGPAKLAFEDAARKAKGEGQDVIDALTKKADECCDSLALEYLEEARRLFKQGNRQLGLEEVDNALSIVRGADVRKKAEGLVDDIEKERVREDVQKVTAVTREDKLAMLAGVWQPAQAEEYDEYGDAFVEAILDLHDGKAEDALPVFEKTLEGAEEPRYLHVELGQAYSVLERPEDSEASFRKFIDALKPTEGGEIRLGAHIALASMAADREDLETSFGEFYAAAEALPEDPRPYRELGRFYLSLELPEEAIEELNRAQKRVDAMRPDWQIHDLLGRAYAECDKPKQAIAQLEEVVSMLNALQITDYPISTGKTLAELYEKEGNLSRAADLYAAMAKGSDRANWGLYHREAARLLGELGLEDEARKMNARADALDAEDAKTETESESESETDSETETETESESETETETE